jgi:hypothetical protein
MKAVKEFWAIAHLRGKTKMRPARFQKVGMSRNSPKAVQGTRGAKGIYKYEMYKDTRHLV